MTGFPHAAPGLKLPTVPGLPANWPELLGEALAGMSADDFETAWRNIGKTVRYLARGGQFEVKP